MKEWRKWLMSALRIALIILVIILALIAAILSGPKDFDENEYKEEPPTLWRIK